MSTTYSRGESTMMRQLQESKEYNQEKMRVLAERTKQLKKLWEENPDGAWYIHEIKELLELPQGDIGVREALSQMRSENVELSVDRKFRLKKAQRPTHR